MHSFNGFKSRLEDMLNRNILPFWLTLMDRDHGGFYGLVENDGTIHKDAEKGVILHSRILWTFSEAYRLTGKKEYLDAADHAYRFLADKAWDPEFEGLYWMLDGSSQPLLTFKHSYNQAFGVYAFSTYYQATRKQEALDYARKLFRLIESVWHDGTGYLEQLTREYQPMSNEELSENGIIAERTMNTILHIMEAYTVLYEVTGDPEVKDALIFCVKQLTNEMYNPDKERLEVFFDKSLHSLLDLHSYGHDIEASWLIDRALDVIGDQHLTAEVSPVTAKLCGHVVRRALSDRGLYFECEDGHDNTQRDWWPQAEAIIGIANDIGKRGTPEEHLEKMYSVLEFLEREVILPSGEWYWTVYEDGSHDAKRELAGPWKCPYHNGRMCMEIMKRFPESGAQS